MDRMPRIDFVSRLLCSLAIASLTLSGLGLRGTAVARAQQAETEQIARPAEAGSTDSGDANAAAGPSVRVRQGARVVPDQSQFALRDMPPEPPTAERQLTLPPLMPSVAARKQSTPNGIQGSVQAQLPAASMPSPSTSFDGLDFASWGSGWPPDAVGDVGPNHYVQAVNTSVGIFDKTGTLLEAQTFNTIWLGASGGGVTPCTGVDSPGTTNHRGSPTVLYDYIDDRWIVADVAYSDPQNGPYYECVAASVSGDPTGTWLRYSIKTDDSFLARDPKMGFWPDGIYMSTNMVDCLDSTCSSSAPEGVRVWAFNRTDLANGFPTTPQDADLGTTYLSLLPSNVHGSPPPSGTPNYFVSNDISSFFLDVWKFHVDWTTPANSTFTGPAHVTIASYADPPATIPEQGGESLVSLGDRLMMQNQYRNLNGAESLWVTHGVASGGVTGFRWYQLNVTGGTIAGSPVQASTYQPDSKHRWVSSLAVDGLGDMAIGYSVSSSTMYPAIRYAGQLVTDAHNTLGQGETDLIAGTGAQSGGGGRWGDYSAMTVDPMDDCTFWYTNEYYSATGNQWRTRIGSFVFPICSSSALVRVTIAGALRGQYIVAPQRSTRVAYAGVNSGPVVVASANTVSIVAAERDSSKVSGKVLSYAQLMGLPVGQLSDTYFFPTYQNAGSVNEQLRIVNMDSSSSTTVTVTIGGAVRGTYTLLPGATKSVNYPRLSSGPVVVKGTPGVNIIAVERDSWKANGKVRSFAQLMGLPASQLSDTYAFPIYTNKGSLTDQLRIANVDSVSSTVTVTIGGVVKGTYVLPPGKTKKVSYPGLNGGPLVVQGTPGVHIIAALRDARVVLGSVKGFAQLMGLPAGQLSDSYAFPSYQKTSALNEQLCIANADSVSSTITVTIRGIFKGTYLLAPGKAKKIVYSSVNAGPVLVQGTPGVHIIAAERDLWKVKGVVTSYAQVMGLPLGLLSDTFLFPSYTKTSTLDQQLRFGVP